MKSLCWRIGPHLLTFYLNWHHVIVLHLIVFLSPRWMSIYNQLLIICVFSSSSWVYRVTMKWDDWRAGPASILENCERAPELCFPESPYGFSAGPSHLSVSLQVIKMLWACTWDSNKEVNSRFGSAVKSERDVKACYKAVWKNAWAPLNILWHLVSPSLWADTQSHTPTYTHSNTNLFVEVNQSTTTGFMNSAGAH